MHVAYTKETKGARLDEQRGKIAITAIVKEFELDQYLTRQGYPGTAV